MTKRYRRVVVVQARMTSTRLPGKILMDLGGRPMLERQLERVKRCQEVDDIVVATTRNSADDAVVALARQVGVKWSRGSECDVLARYAQAAAESEADMVIRVTADCPLLDPVEVDAVVTALDERRSTTDYASNRLEAHMPRGLDVEAMWRDALERTNRMATSAAAREHVTWFMYAERPELFALHAVRRPFDASDLRWTVDTSDDLAMVRRLYDDLALGEKVLSTAQVISHVRRNPEIAQLNGHVQQKDPNG